MRSNWFSQLHGNQIGMSFSQHWEYFVEVLASSFLEPSTTHCLSASIEVKGEFKKYYSVEYANLSEYLEIRYGKL
jgi:hypothetical protein